MNPAAAFSLYLIFTPFGYGEPPSVIFLRHELLRFPSAEACCKQRQRADRHLAWIEKRMLLFPHDRYELWQYRCQVAEWREVWDKLETCQVNDFSAYNEGRLDFIRKAIGEWNYRMGYVPEPVAQCFLVYGQ